MLKFFNRLLNISTADPDDARKRKILNILLVGTGTLALLALLLSIYFFATLPEQTGEINIIFWGSTATFVGTLVIYGINQYYSGRVASTIFLVFLIIVFTFSDTPEQVAGGRALFTFTVPIFMASILLAPFASFIFAGLTGLAISALALSIGYVPNSPAIILFFLIAYVSWLSARSLEQALNELRTINVNLDHVVAERTQELAESLSREKIEAGRNQAILNSIADGVIVFDKRWHAMQANPAIKGLLDIPLELIVNKSFRDLIEHPRLAAKSRPLLYAMMDHGTQPIGFRVEWSEKTLSVGAASVYDSLGLNIGTVIVFRDFTREAEVEKLKSTFVGIVSHELRTPLNAILGYSEMFKEAVYGPMNEKQINTADRIMKNTERLLGLINDLLDQAQMEAGKMTIRMQVVRPAELIDALHGVLDKSAADKNLKLTSEIDPFLPEALNGDPARLQQILVNLVNNAIKFTERGGVNVLLFQREDTQWGIEVADTGSGILESQLPFIFDTFRQVDSTDNRSHGGFGLGLSIVKQLVGFMNGQIKVKSELEKGTTFTITLPLIVPDGDQ
jgi:signal transduction histidine kinase